MKTKIAIYLIALLFTGFSVSAQKKAEVKIKTTAECNMCKKTLESTLNQMKGVKKASVDMSTKDATIIYNPKKVSVEELKKAIVGLGYDADEMKANTKAYQALPDCCKKGEPHENK